MLTEAKRLFTGEPVWESYRKPRIPTRELNGSISVDVVVIGGGVSGAMIAESLSGHDLDIAIVDRRAPLTGSTSASTALIQYEIDVPLTKLTKQIGAERAASAWRRSRVAVEGIAAKIRANEIDCDFTRKDSLFLAGDMLDRKGLEQEAWAREAIGIPTVLLGSQHLERNYGIKCDAALLNQNNLTCNPVQLTGGFLKAAIARGANFYPHITIEELQHRGKNIVLSTDTGYEIKTRYVVYASGYEMPVGVHPKKHAIASTYALATAPRKGFDIPLFWQASDPYVYGRPSMDGRMIFGGEDEEFGDEDRRDELMGKKQKALEHKLAKLFPDYTFETTHFWAACFGGSDTGLPSIGRLPGEQNIYCAMAYGGNGITFSRIAADLISASILEPPDPEEALFAF
ncbi:MAG: FAD-binding oxidoreductase [Candidatus Devosia phytovorans]|uniref:FAD-binding oxidoreductase n=1 Tax=Candidatus Devosia phytovorans TaxID=3121372 RepID=A0AAJ5VV61_9HYPH|nr:FAD-binding oxidoreductase [Devosia sp.]WEK04720.1 MAG: FAD-binding oxidoreductase [Devosia sp.]